MRIVKRIPKSAVCFYESESLSLYFTDNCVYVVTERYDRENGKFIDKGEIMIERFNFEEFSQYLGMLSFVYSVAKIHFMTKEVSYIA